MWQAFGLLPHAARPFVAVGYYGGVGKACNTIAQGNALGMSTLQN